MTVVATVVDAVSAFVDAGLADDDATLFGEVAVVVTATVDVTRTVVSAVGARVVS